MVSNSVLVRYPSISSCNDYRNHIDSLFRLSISYRTPFSFDIHQYHRVSTIENISIFAFSFIDIISTSVLVRYPSIPCWLTHHKCYSDPHSLTVPCLLCRRLSPFLFFFVFPFFAFCCNLLFIYFIYTCYCFIDAWCIQAIVKSVQLKSGALNGGDARDENILNDDPGWIEVLWPR